MVTLNKAKADTLWQGVNSDLLLHNHPPPNFHTLTFRYSVVLKSALPSKPTAFALSLWKPVLFPLWKCVAFLLLISVLSLMNWVKFKLLEMEGRCLSSMWMCYTPDTGIIYIFLLSCPGPCPAKYIRIAKYSKVLILSFIKCWCDVMIAGCVIGSANSYWLSLATLLWIFGKAAVSCFRVVCYGSSP